MVPVLVANLGDKDAEVRRGAAYVLGEVGEAAKSAAPALRAALKDSRPMCGEPRARPSRIGGKSEHPDHPRGQRRAAAFSACGGPSTLVCRPLRRRRSARARPVQRLPGRYPHGFRAALEQAPRAPWIYTGGLETGRACRASE